MSFLSIHVRGNPIRNSVFGRTPRVTIHFVHFRGLDEMVDVAAAFLIDLFGVYL